MDERDRFIARYSEPSDDAITAAGTAYLAITGSVNVKAMEEAVRQAFRVNSYKHPLPQSNGYANLSEAEIGGYRTQNRGKWNSSLIATVLLWIAFAMAITAKDPGRPAHHNIDVGRGWECTKGEPTNCSQWTKL